MPFLQSFPMSGANEVIELLSSSDESSSSDSELRRPPRRTQQSYSSSEEEKTQLKRKQQQPARSSRGLKPSNGRSRKRIASSESESSHESESERNWRAILEPLDRPQKRVKVVATKPYVAPVARPRHDRRADGEMRQITEGMNFAELQAQQQMMARFQAQNRRKAPLKPRMDESSQRPRKISAPSIDAAKRASTESKHLAEIRNSSGLQAQERTTTQHHVRKSVPTKWLKKYAIESESEEGDESEERDDDWDEFKRKSAHRENLRKQNRQVVRTSAEVTRSAHKSAVFTEDNRKQKRTQLAARKTAMSKQPDLRMSVTRTPVLKTSRSQKLTKESSSSSEEENEVAREAASEAESGEKSGGESEEDDVLLVKQSVGEKKTSLKKKETTSKKSNVWNGSSKRRSPSPANPVDINTASPAVHHGVNDLQSLAEKMSFVELQAQEQALSFFQAQRKRHATVAAVSVPSSGHTVHSQNGSNGTIRARKTSGGGRRARMGITQKEVPETSSTVSFVGPPSRSGFLSSSAQSLSPAKCTTTPVQKPANPVIHSTAWRRLIFAEAPSNILQAVSTIPYSAGSDKPLWDYDPTKKLEEKCKFVASVGQGIAITEDNYDLQQLSQDEVYGQVRELVDQELPYIKLCHSKRVKHILRDTRKQVAGYLKTHQVLRGDLVRRLQWSEIANHQSWLDVSPIERVTARRILHNPTHTIRPYNYLVGNVRYFVHRDQTVLESLVYPETVTHLPDDITPIRRSFTMIGVRKNDFVDDDPILRYIPYLGDGERLGIDTNLYTETTMSKERQIDMVGEGEELKVMTPSSRDDEVKEYLLRIIVGKCGASEQVFLALQHEAGFDKPRIDYCAIQAVYEAERITAKRIAKVKRLISSDLTSPANRNTNAVGWNTCKTLRKLAQWCWFLRDPADSRSLGVRLQPPLSVFESCYAEAPEGFGLRNHSTYDGLVEWHRDLFCRRCYSYDCSEHGIQNPQRSLRADPIYPMVNAPGIVLARQEMPMEEYDLSAEDGTPSSSSPGDREVIELTGGSSSEDEIEEKKNEESTASQLEPGYRRSRRAQTRISSLASKSLQLQEKIQETERLAELEKRRKRREKFARAADNSEYLDNSYLPTVTTTLKKLLSKSQPCSPSCWLSVADKEPSAVYVTFGSRVDLVLVRKLACTFGPNACVIAAMLKSSRCTCADISRFLVEEKKRRDSGDNLGADNDPLLSVERRQKPRRHNGGVGSNRSMAKRARRPGGYDREKKMSYKPCNHDGVCDERCDCKLRGHTCIKTCSCPRDCPNRFQGCKCSKGNCHTPACPCWDAGLECDPDYCFSCGASDGAVMAFHPKLKSRGSYDLKICLNVDLLRGSIPKKVGVAFSDTHGWGAYALEPIRKEEFVLEYTGELITDEEAERRGAIYDRKSVSYLFGVNSEYVVDAARKGNKAKFANHKVKEEANLEVRIVASNGEHRIGLFAREAIEVGAELFFDYGYTHETAPKWSQLGQPESEQKRAYDVVDDENEWEQWE